MFWIYLVNKKLKFWKYLNKIYICDKINCKKGGIEDLKTSLKEFNRNERQEESLDKVSENFKFLIDLAKQNLEDKKKAENRMFDNIDDVWDKLREELSIISES